MSYTHSSHKLDETSLKQEALYKFEGLIRRLARVNDIHLYRYVSVTQNNSPYLCII